MRNSDQEHMVGFLVSLHQDGPGLNIRVGNTTFENVVDVPVVARVNSLVNGAMSIELDSWLYINKSLAQRVIGILNGEDEE